MTETGELTPGQLFGGYRIQRLLGRGGMGAVYAAEQVDDGRQVAVKVLSAALASDVDRERFLREGTLAASVNHPNTVYVYRTEEVDGQPLIAMELVNGGTLEEKVRASGPLAIEEAINDTLQVVDGLEAAARVGILHRDVKPANCFVGLSGVVKVGDFGLSRPVDQADRQRLTQSGIFVGTPVFSSPEQLMGEGLDVRSDIYSVGATLYFLLTGTLPYDAENAVRLIAMVVGGGATPLSRHRPDAPEGLEAVVMRCLARQREARFAAYQELREALVACLPQPAGTALLGRRVMAGVLDYMGVSTAWTPLVAATSAMLGYNTTALYLQQSAVIGLISLAVELPVRLLWFGVPEWRWGMSPGKFLAGIQVSRLRGGLPTFAQACARATIVWLPSIFGTVVLFAGGTRRQRALLSVALWLVPVCLLFVRARRRNGFAAEHDRLTGTRVVRRIGRAPSRSEEWAAPAPSTIPRRDERIGPYDILGTLHGSSRVSVGEDPLMRRRVWIVRSEGEAPPLADEERNAARPGCLRWVAGRRTAAEGWDAYAALSGEPLGERLARPAGWIEVRRWLDDLAGELSARRDPAWDILHLTARYVWITADDHAVLLPFSVGPAARRPGEPAGLFANVLWALDDPGATTRLRDGWSLGADRVLAAIARTPGDLPAIRQALDGIREASGPVTVGRRVALLAVTGVPAVFLVLFFATTMHLTLFSSPEVARTAALISYLDHPVEVFGPSPDHRRLVEVYLAGHHRALIASRGEGRPTLLTPGEWQLADSVLARHRQVASAELRAADRLVDSTWQGRPPGQAPNAMRALLLAFAFVTIVMGALSFVLATTARRGLAMRLLKLEFITPSRRRAGRLRLVWRQALAWLPYGLLALLALMVEEYGALSVFVVPVLLAVAVIAVGMVVAMRTPARGLAERGAGVRVVAE